MILTFNLTATETAALQARADAYNAAVAKLADKLIPPPLSLDDFVAREVQLRIIDAFVGAFVTEHNDALIAGVLRLPPDQLAQVQTLVSANAAPIGVVAPAPVTLPPTGV